MATLEEVYAAEQRMNKARDALLAYVQRPPSQPADGQLHRELAEQLKRATDDYATAVAQLKP